MSIVKNAAGVYIKQESELNAHFLTKAVLKTARISYSYVFSSPPPTSEQFLPTKTDPAAV